MSHFCSMTRRQLFASFTAAATTASLSAVGAAQSAEAGGGTSPSVILGNGEYRYQVVGNWGELPPGYTYGDSAAVCVDSKDNVYVFTRGSHPVIVFDRNGKFLRSWGEDIGFTNAHGAAVGPDDMLYLTDDFGHAVRKCTTGRQGCADNRNTEKVRPRIQRRTVQPLHSYRPLAARRHLRFRRLCQCPRSQIFAGRQAAVLLGRAGHRSWTVQSGPQYRLRRRGLGLCRRSRKSSGAGLRRQRQVRGAMAQSHAPLRPLRHSRQKAHRGDR